MGGVDESDLWAMKVVNVFFPLLVFAAVIGVVVFDSRFHFSQDLIQGKRAHRSPQRHWNIWYNQSYVFYDSPLRYQTDLARIEEIIEPGYSVWSDLATSYYAAATLPVHVRNIHQHHGLRRLKWVLKFIEGQHFCYLADRSHRQATLDFFNRDSLLSLKNGWPELRYIILNKDKKNSLLRNDCMAVLSSRLEVSLPDISQLLYEGEYLNVYQLNSFSMPPP